MAMNGDVDGELDMMCEGLFDNIDDLLDFSTDDEVLVESAAAGGNGCHQIDPPSATIAALSSANEEGSRVIPTSEENKICDDININIGEDWITNFLDDSNFDIDFPATPAAIIAAAPKDEPLFQSFSPVSVLEEPNNLSISSSEKRGGSSSSSSSSSPSNNHNVTAAPVGPTMMLLPARARSKRPRRATPAPSHVTIPILPTATEGPPAVPTLLPDFECFGESPCPVPPMKKKKKKSLGLGAGNACSEDGMAVRKCQHCGIQKTPQWRGGPMGPKTLCNACGVRYKSGRLFPEYRPAASPTFVPSLHSNSHKKVVEMRIKACQQKVPSPEYPAAKNCDLLAYIRRRE